MTSDTITLEQLQALSNNNGQQSPQQQAMAKFMAGNYLTSEQIKQQYAYANTLREHSLEPVRHPLGIAARVAQALAGGNEINKLNDAQQQRQLGLAHLYQSLSPPQNTTSMIPPAPQATPTIPPPPPVADNSAIPLPRPRPLDAGPPNTAPV